MARNKAKKSHTVITYALTALVGLVLVAVVVKGFAGNRAGRKPAPADTQQENLPQYVLSQGEEAQVKAFVQNFVSLYNTYSTDDVSNLKAIGDYETEAMQQKTAALVAQLQNTLPPGFSSRGDAVPSTFSYAYPNASGLRVAMQVRISQANPQTGKFSQFTSQANLVLQRQSTRWVVDDIKINQ